jgi:hypothetical protein
MKYLHRLLALLSISVAVFSCQKEYSLENPTGSNTPTAQWEFKEAGVQFKGPVDTVSIDTLSGFKFLTINGRSDDGSSQITLQVFGADLKPGTYKTPFSLFAYIKAGNVVYQTDQTSVDSFTIVLTKVDTSGVTGTFSGKALSGNTSKKIVDGKFNAVFKGTTPVTPPSTKDSGQVMLWSKAGCGGGASTTAINVTVNGKAGQLTKFFAAEPSTCDPVGSFYVKLPVGTYPWVAKCGTDSIKGNVTVTKNGCTKTEVNFTAPPLTGDYFPMTVNSNWTYLHAGSVASDTVRVTSTGVQANYASNAYNMFINDYGPGGFDSSFYRKTGNSYVEYYPVDYNAFGFDPPGVAVEHIFLKDNVTPGTAAAIWSTPYSGKFQGIPVSAQIRDTVVAKLASFTVGTLPAYSDVLEVHSGYYIIATPAPATQLYIIKQWFAKGVGLVKYTQIDVIAGTEYTINITRSQVF